MEFILKKMIIFCRFQKYQQQLQQKHGHSSQSSPLSQTPEGLASISDRSPGDEGRFTLGHGGGPVSGVVQTGAFPGGAQVNRKCQYIYIHIIN